MAFKLPHRPSPRPAPHELADFAELLVLLRGRCSATEIQRYLGRIDENDNNIGIEDDDLANECLSDAMMAEIGYRAAACPNGYPFVTDTTGSILELRDDADSIKQLVYRFLLFATRLSMRDEKIQGGFDGTQLMEDLGAEVLRSYLGAKGRAEVFGTARRGGFPSKINALCQSLEEGGRFESIDPGDVNANDDGLDVVGWIPFTDRLSGKMCVFGQCKTGTSWRDHLHRLDPPGLVKRWMSGTIVVDPMKAYFIAESADRSQWKGACIYGGIMFDRCRIADLAENIDSGLLDRIERWTNSSFDKLAEWDWS